MSEFPDPFDAATRRIQAAQCCPDGDFPGVAVAETYYAMMDLIRGALRRRDIQAKTHAGLETLFFKHFVDPGPTPGRSIRPSFTLTKPSGDGTTGSSNQTEKRSNVISRPLPR